MIKVYHRKNLYSPEKVETSIDCSALNLDEFDLVAEVETSDLEVAWELTNTCEISWPKLDGVKNLTGHASWDIRSTSVGDLLIDSEGKSHLVDYMGFKSISTK